MRSIRANLVLWLVGALTLGAVLVLAVTYWLTRQQVGRLFDEELKQVALAVHVREDWVDRRLRIARPGFFLSVRAYNIAGRVFFETALPSLPGDIEQTFEEGFVHRYSEEGAWRLYTHVTPEGIVQVGQPLAAREALARDLSLKVLTPMLLLIPVLAGLLAWALRRTLAPLDEASRRVSDRDAARLDPLPTHNVPAELLPLVGQVNALLARLAGALDGQRRFLADAAHELRSPVAALALQVQLAERASDGQARASAFQELKRGIERSRRLVQQLLDFARLESGVPAETQAPVDVARVARDVVATYSAHAEALGVDLGAEAREAAWIAGAEAELHSLIANLVDNALRYAPRESAVTVTVFRNGNDVDLTVSDAGPGIAEAEKTRVFQRFHRVAGDTTSGSGLGLSIVKAIVERHDAAIRLEAAQPGAVPPGLAVRIRFRALALPRVKSAGLALSVP